MKRFAALMLFLVFTVSLAACQNKPELIAKVGDCEVPLEEYRLFAYDYLSTTAAEFSQNYNADPNDKAFWETEFDGKRPIDMVTQKADEQMREQKARQLLAKQYGLLQDAGYPAFLKEFEAENKERREKLKKGETVYGPKELTLAQFYSYRQSQMEEALKQYAQENLVNPSEEELKAFYPELANEMSSRFFTARLGLFLWEGEKDASALSQALESRIKQGESPEAAAKADGVSYREQELVTRELGKEDYDLERIFTQVRDLSAGQFSTEFALENGRALALVLERKDEDFGSYEETRATVEETYRERKAAALLEEQSKELAVVFTARHKTLAYSDLKG